MSLVTDSVFRLGDDAMDNYYDIRIVSSVQAINVAFGDLTYRVQTLKASDFSLSTYKIHYKSDYDYKVSSKYEGDKKITLVFREDKSRTLYSAFKAWYNLAFDLESGEVGEDVSSITGSVNYRASLIVDHVDAQGVNFGGTLEYQGVFVESITNPQYTYRQGQPIECTVGLVYRNIVDVGI